MPAFKEMDLLKDQLTLNIMTMIGFNGGATRSIREVSLPMYADGVVKPTMFTMVDPHHGSRALYFPSCDQILRGESSGESIQRTT